MKRKFRPSVEGLEDRFLLYATSGNAWTKPARITFSFASYGTSIGGVSNDLQSTIPSPYSEIRKAAAQWEDTTNIDMVEVGDNGAAIGSTGNQQGDSNFGDIRIGAYPQAMTQLGYAYSPPPSNGGTNAGDFFLNSSQSWQTDGSSYDVRTVALHEFGHALGLAHSSNSNAAMYPTYHGLTSWQLTSDDISGMQAIYGTRPNDAYEGTLNNNSSTRATDVTPLIDGNLQVRTTANNTSVTDTDWYKVTVPSGNNGTMVVQLQSENLSMLESTIEIFKSSGGTLTTQGGPQTATFYNWTYSNPISVSTGDVYYIKELPGTTIAGVTGTYGFLLNFGNVALTPIAPPNTTVAATADTGPGTQQEDVFTPKVEKAPDFVMLPDIVTDFFKKKK